MKILNPFADYGKIVYGNRFIGREDNIRTIDNRIINPSKSGNLAIIGMPRIGKSSLAWKAIMERKEMLLSRKIIPIWIDVGIFNKITDFFCDIVAECENELKRLNLINDTIIDIVNQIYDDNLLWNKRFNFILKFLKMIKDLNYKLIVILDEFDNARNIFKDTAEGFQKLRALSYNPKYSVTFITTSRRSIKNIEKILKGSSTFYETFMDNNLGVFNNDDIEKYFDIFSSVGISLSIEDKNEILYYTGKHPYLLDILSYEIIEKYLDEKKINVEKVSSNIEEKIVKHYDHLVDILKENGTISKLLQISIGPQVDITGADINSLLSYSLIKKSNENEYHAFSRHFQDYLKMINRGIDLWPILGETERKLREIISISIYKKFGEDWLEKLEKRNQKLEKIFDRARKDQEKEKRSFGAKASTDLLDYTYPMDLFAIIFCEWKEVFEPIFGVGQQGKTIQKSYWQTRIEFISKFRNPLAHNRVNTIRDYEKQIVDGYCKEIIGFIKRYKERE